MNNNFTLIWSFRNRFEILKKSILSAHKYSPLDVDFCLIDAASDEETIKQLRELCNSLEGRTIRICESSFRSSLSQAWNLGMMLTKNRYVIFSSSDVLFTNSGWVEALKEVIINQGNEYVLIDNHAVFGFDKKVIPKMGWFDEEFGIGPHFDTDFMIRASENNIRFGILQNNGYYKHGEDDDTKQRLLSDCGDRLPMNSKVNENLFKAKWSSSWPGWIPVDENYNNLHHPPTHISQVRRMVNETDPHPIYTKLLK